VYTLQIIYEIAPDDTRESFVEYSFMYREGGAGSDENTDPPFVCHIRADTPLTSGEDFISSGDTVYFVTVAKNEYDDQVGYHGLFLRRLTN
jgi:hypothetical protein